MPLAFVTLMIVAGFAALGAAIYGAANLDDGAPLAVAKAVGAKLRLLPGPLFGTTSEPPGTTRAQEVAAATSGWLTASTKGLADTSNVERQPTVAGSFAIALGASARIVSQDFQPDAAANLPTVAGAGAASAAAALLDFAGNSPGTHLAQAMQDAPQPPSPTITATGRAPTPAPSPSANAPLSTSSRDDATALAEAAVQPDEPDAKLAERAAVMADQVNKGATDIMGKLPPEEPKPGQAANAGAARITQAPAAEVPAAPAAGEPLTIASARYTGQGASPGLISLSGRGAPGRPVALYLDDARLGGTVTSAGGQWRLEAITRVAVGQHRARADLTPAPGRPAESAVLVFARNPPANSGGQPAVATLVSGAKASPAPQPKRIADSAAPISAAKPAAPKAKPHQPERTVQKSRPALVAAAAQQHRARPPASKPVVTKLFTAKRRTTLPAGTQGQPLATVRVFRGKHQIIVRVPGSAVGAYVGGGGE